MPPSLIIPRTNAPLWLSDSIIPSKDTVLSTINQPKIAAISPTSTDVKVYVRVKNDGNTDFGVCACLATGLWTEPTLFQGFLSNPNQTQTATQASVTFTASPQGDSLSGAVSRQFNSGLVPDRRAWAWSPDGRYFAYVYMPKNSPTEWYLEIVALQNVTRSDGSIFTKGQFTSDNGLFASGSSPLQYWNNSNFFWSRSRAVLASGAYVSSTSTFQQWSRTLICPEAPTNQRKWTDAPLQMEPGKIDWLYLVSPCDSAVAFVPKRLNSSATPKDLIIVKTTDAKVVQLKRNNISTSVNITGDSPSITTTQHSANGITIDLGVNTSPRTIITIDDPECTFTGGGVTVHVDRVKVSTLPSANSGIVEVGKASVGLLKQGATLWIQVPNVNGWTNQSEPHWCLLAQTYTSDLTTIPRPWNGQVGSPPAFPINNTRCAQRNISII
ncbi:MAG: hypothetical protein LCI00_31580 [Chloroflexi bacterium]|nr:hypothetical protein [Chloroflexota bacterium]MCC6893607.1 hypothetical protein [Anaerolineae bacterium]